MLKKMVLNKIFIYLFSRYLTYAIQFTSSIFIALKLGLECLGTWGFMLLLINIFQISNFGISNSVNILLVQYKNNDEKTRNVFYTALGLVSIVCLIPVLLAIYYYYFGIPLFEKYSIGKFLYLIITIAVLSYINRLLMTVYRVKNGILEVAFFQFSIQALVLITVFSVNDKYLLLSLLLSYILGHFLSFLVFCNGSKLPKGGSVTVKVATLVAKKSLIYFVYNIFFYLILISTRSLISAFYTVEEYGYFVFSFTLANSLFLILEAVAFLIFPKVVDKLGSKNSKDIIAVINRIRSSYVFFAHGMIYLGLAIFPIFLDYTQQYKDTIFTITLIALSLVLNANAFGYNAYLMAQNKESVIAKISLFSFFSNLLIAFILIYALQVGYEYIVISTMMAYLFYSYLCVFFGKKYLGEKLSIYHVFNSFFPVNLIFPYLLALLLVIIKSNLMFVPLILFLALNIKTVKKGIGTIRKLIINPSLLDI